MDRAAFYASLRKWDSGVFGTSLTQGQVKGCEAILDECLAQRADLGQAAYILATAYGETGRKMQPVEENLRYSAGRIQQVFSATRRQGRTPRELAGNPKLLANTVYGGPWGARNLGNTEEGDGWRFRGMGIGQITGRHNFTKWSLKMGIDLVGHPQVIMQLNISVKALVQPMLEGWASGRKLGEFVDGYQRDYLSARQTWNGMFAAADYAKYAQAFETALRAAGYSVTTKTAQKPVQAYKATTQPVTQKDTPLSPVSALMKAVLALFKGRK